MDVYPHLLQGQAHVAIAPAVSGPAIAIVWLPPVTPSNPQPLVQTKLAAVVQPHRGLRPLRAHKRDKVKRANPVPTDTDTDTGTDNFYELVSGLDF